MEQNDIQKAFARNLKFYLSREGKTQADMTKYMGVSSATTSDWCNGKKIPRADKLQSICNWLDISLSQLMTTEDPYIVPKPNSNRWYNDATVLKMAEKIRYDDEYRVLFDAASNVRQEDIRLVTQLIKRLTR